MIFKSAFKPLKGYKYDITSGVPSQLFTTENVVCVVVAQSVNTVVECKTHDLTTKWIQVYSTTKKFVKIGIVESENADELSLYVFESTESSSDAYYTVDVKVLKFEPQSLNDNEKVRGVDAWVDVDSIQIRGELKNVDVVSKKGKCKTDRCKISAGVTDEKNFLGPDNGGCEQRCLARDETVNVDCSCAPNYKLRADKKSCVRLAGEGSFIHNQTCVSRLQSKGEVEGEFWQCSEQDKCLELRQVCDGIRDCVGGEDEQFCLGWHTGKEAAGVNMHRHSHVHCPEGYYRCHNGQCVGEETIYWVNQKVLQESLTAVRFGTYDNGKYMNAIVKGCYDKSNIFSEERYGRELFCAHASCDNEKAAHGMVNDEPERAQQERNGNKLVCQPGERKCPSKEDGRDICAALCDDIVECRDNIDELGCADKCADESQFQCSGVFSVCIDRTERCDGQPQCIDGDDEENCQECAGDAFYCGAEDGTDASCISAGLVCNGAYDCESKLDEQSCPAGSVNPGEPCERGFYFNPATKDCKKIDAAHCSVAHFPCSQICVGGKPGTSASCECLPGYDLVPNSPDCHAENAPDSPYYPQVMYANQRSVRMVDWKAGNEAESRVMSEGHKNVVAFDYNWKLNTFYWTMVVRGNSADSIISATSVPDMGNISSYYSDLLRSNVTKFSLHEVDQVDAIAVDWVTNNVYFGDKLKSKIKVMSADGKFVRTLAGKEQCSKSLTRII